MYRSCSKDLGYILFFLEIIKQHVHTRGCVVDMNFRVIMHSMYTVHSMRYCYLIAKFCRILKFTFKKMKIGYLWVEYRWIFVIQNSKVTREMTLSLSFLSKLIVNVFSSGFFLLNRQLCNPLRDNERCDCFFCFRSSHYTGTIYKS